MTTYHDSHDLHDLGSGPQMNGVPCPICGQECYNTWGLWEHLWGKHGKKKGLLEANERGFDLALFPWEDPALVVAEAEAILEEQDSKPGLGVELWWPWDNGDQTDEDQGSTDDDPEPSETEEGGDDDGRSNDDLDASLDFDYLLTQLRQRGGCPCPVGRIDPVMQDIEDARFELAFVSGKTWI